MSIMTGQMYYKRKSDGALIPINPGQKGDQGPTGLKGDKGDSGPPVATGGITQVDADNRYLLISGGTLTGALTLAGNPGADNEPATKFYVDTVFNDSPPVNMPTTYGEEEVAAGNPTGDPSLATPVHAIPYPDAGDGLLVRRALELIALALDDNLPVILHGSAAPPEPASNYPDGTLYFKTVV